MMILILVALMVSSAGLASAQQSAFGDLAVCSNCHKQIQPPAAAVDLASARLYPRSRPAAQPAASAIGPAELWPASMMAHAAVDPYWKAKVRYETGQNPALTGVIEDTCLRCHAPMQQYELRGTGTLMKLDDINAIGAQGVGCTVCHQITDEGFGTKESFEAGFVINPNREVYGPHTFPFGNPMIMQAGYTPVERQHMLESALCGTCHTVVTPTVDSNGAVVGEFVEQAAYLEWVVSDFPAEGKTCQSCHMPVLKDSIGRPAAQYIAHRPNNAFPFPPTSPRTPFGQHFLVGGNAPMLQLLAQQFPNEAGMLSANLERTRESLSGSLSLELNGNREEGTVNVRVKVINNTGHKLPTAYPSRRVWLHLSLLDAGGRLLFDSGSWDPRTGRVNGIGDWEPHRDTIRDASEVMIYETETADTDGKLTVTLLRAARSLKDNRILPRGFDERRGLPEGINPDSIAPVGTEDDIDFRPGSDEVKYQIATGSAAGPYRVVLEALYQSIKPSHVAAMDAQHSAEEATFIGLYHNNRSPVVMARQEILVR